MESLGSTLYLLRLVKLVLEVAGLSLIGLAVLSVMIRAVGRDPQANFAYRALQVVVSPFVRIVRAITPRFVSDRHVPIALFGLVVVAWGWVSFLAIPNACHSRGLPIVECVRR